MDERFYLYVSIGFPTCWKSLTVFGGYSEEETPVLIPNTEVKLFSADGTARAAEWESRTPPDFFAGPD